LIPSSIESRPLKLSLKQDEIDDDVLGLGKKSLFDNEDD
jgi:hypothetical protein